jgi:lipoteichoic acid synthase
MRRLGNGIFLVFATAKILNAWRVGWPALDQLAGWLGQDALVALVFAALARCLPRWLGLVGYALLAALAALSAAMVQALGTPLTAPMLRGFDFTMSDSVAHCATFAGLAVPLVVVLVALLAPRLRGLDRARGPVVVAGLVLGALGLAAGEPNLPAHRNSLWTLLRSALPRIGVAASADDFRPARAAPLETGLEHLVGTSAGRDVIVVVLESAAARFLAPYGADQDPMPFLTSLTPKSLRCTDAYAVYPESIKGQIALFHGVHPAPHTDAEAYARVPVPGLAGLLAGHGYASALFHSGRFRFLGMEAVLTQSGFAHRADAAGIGGEVESSFGVDEKSTVDALLRWVDAQAPTRPLCAAYLPVAGHHPYSHPGGPFSDEHMLGSYRNALHYADRSVRRLWEGLVARGRAERTVLCVVGDHGQAFGEHAGNFGHTFCLYEENLRVPLLFHAPGRTDVGLVCPRVVSHVDVVPTLLAMLGIAPHPAHEGASLLTPQTRPALFFADWGSSLLGVRDGDLKCIHEVDTGTTLVFDLAADPHEARDVSAAHPGFAAQWRRALPAWAAARRAAVAHWPPPSAPITDR